MSESERPLRAARRVLAIGVCVVAIATLVGAVGSMTEQQTVESSVVTEQGEVSEGVEHVMTLDASVIGQGADDLSSDVGSVEVDRAAVSTPLDVPEARALGTASRVLALLPLVLGSIAVVVVTRRWYLRRPWTRAVEWWIASVAAALAAAAILAPRLDLRARESFRLALDLPDCLEPSTTLCFPPQQGGETDLLLLAVAFVVGAGVVAMRNARLLRRDVEGLV